MTNGELSPDLHQPIPPAGALTTGGKETGDALRRVAREQAALRRVATLVASESTPEEVFAAVAGEVAQVLEVQLVQMSRYVSPDAVTVVATWGDQPMTPGSTWPLDGPTLSAQVFRTGRPARIDNYSDYSDLPETIADAIRATGIRSGVAAPVVVAGRLWGVMMVLSTDPAPLPSETEARLANFTELVAAAISNAEARDGLEALAEEQAALRRVATLIAREVRPSEVFAAVAREVARTLDVALTAVIRFGADATATQVGAWGAENPFPVGTSWPLDELSVSGQVARTSQPARVDDYAAIPGGIASRLAREAGIHTAVGVPILVDGRPWGAMMALSTSERPLRDDTEARLGAFTELIATAIANTQARDDLSRLVDEQAALRRVALLVAQEADQAEIFAAVAREVSHVLGDAMIEIVRCEPGERATGVGAWGDHPFAVGSEWTLDGPSVVASVIESGGPARIDDYTALPGSVAAFTREGGFRSAVGAPITVDGKTWGVISVISREAEPLPPETEDRLMSFSELIAMAISNAQSRDALDVFVREQEALRRVATLTAAGASTEKVFDAVAEEVKELLDLPVVALTRYEPDNTVSMLAAAGPHPFQRGTRWPLEGLPVASMVLERSAPAYLEEYVTENETTGPAIESARVRSGLAVPIFIGNKVWGTISTASTDVPLPRGIEERLIGFTELVAAAVLNAQARDELSEIADEQAALRRVATLVAEGAGSPAVYDAICQETGLVIGATSVNLCHFTPDRFNLTMAGWSLHDTHIPTGTRLPIEGGTINEVVYETAAPARVDSYGDAQGALADLIRERGIKSEVAAPVVVDGRLWGSIIAGWDVDGAPPPGSERRLAGFAELIATAVSNALTRSELVASRARIVAAADEARRRIERNLHDGIQQQLVALGLDLRSLMSMEPPGTDELQAELERIQGDLGSVIDDVREISRGVHPALLSHSGLGAAIKALARRSPIPVDVTVDSSPRLPQSIEIAAYYVASEALANAAKHSEATVIQLAMAVSSDGLALSITDDGVGGARVQSGSGLMGLVDRVEALGGGLSVQSPPGSGTAITVELPLEAADAD